MERGRKRNDQNDSRAYISVRIQAIIRDIPRRCHFRVTHTLWTRSRFSFASLIFDAYLRKKLTEFTFAVGETRVDDEMIPTVLEL